MFPKILDGAEFVFIHLMTILEKIYWDNGGNCTLCKHILL